MYTSFTVFLSLFHYSHCLIQDIWTIYHLHVGTIRVGKEHCVYVCIFSFNNKSSNIICLQSFPCVLLFLYYLSLKHHQLLSLFSVLCFSQCHLLFCARKSEVRIVLSVVIIITSVSYISSVYLISMQIPCIISFLRSSLNCISSWGG